MMKKMLALFSFCVVGFTFSYVSGDYYSINELKECSHQAKLNGGALGTKEYDEYFYYCLGQKELIDGDDNQAVYEHSLEYTNSQRQGIDIISSFIIGDAKQIINKNTHEYLCSLGGEYCAEAGFQSFLEWEKKYQYQLLVNTKKYLKDYNFLPTNIKNNLVNEILLEYYYGMIATKQFEKTQKMQGGKNIKSLEWYKKNYSNIQGIIIGIPWIEEGVVDIKKELINKIKQIKSVYTYLGSNTYKFPVIVLEKVTGNKTKHTVYEVTKKIDKGKITHISSKLLGSYITKYIPCEGCKPVIYFYPTKTIDITAKLDLKGKFSITYPQIDANNTRSVTAEPDGTLTDKKDGKEYSYIFREAKKMKPRKIDQGFVVKKKDYTAFLQEKLAYLGLTPREYNEFIVYRVPLMNQYPYVALKFAGEDYKLQAPLSIIPTPDSMQRVFMIFKGLDKKINLPTQKLEPFVRSGFSVIERGGTEIYN